MSRELGDRLGRIELIELYERGRRSPKGISRVLKARDGFADNVVHELDMRRGIDVAPLEPFATEARVARLDALCQVRTRIFAPAKAARGLTLAAPTSSGEPVRGHRWPAPPRISHWRWRVGPSGWPASAATAWPS